jgi:DNA-binding transcriptional ArsR family regulator
MIVNDIHIPARHQTDAAKIQNVRNQLPDNDMLTAITLFFGWLSDMTRLKIVIALKTSELCVHEIAETIGLSVSAVSHQLRLLKAAKMVKSRREGKMIYYSLDDEHIDQLLSLADSHIRENV